MSIPFLDLKWQHRQIADSLMPRIQSVIDNTAFTMGPDVVEFESNFAKYLGVAHVVGVDNGTDALTLAYQAIGLKAGDEIITIPTTYIATVAAAMQLGIRPVFVDIDETTRNFDFLKLEAAITPKTRAIVAVHLYGDMADMDSVTAIARKHSLLVVEDSAQAHGAAYKGKRAGTFGDISTFSFYPGKNLGAYGQGGAVATNDPATAEVLKKMRNQGEAVKYNHEIIGHNSRLDTLQAVVLDEKLKKLDEWNALRRTVALGYETLLDTADLQLPPRNPDIEHVFHLYVIELLKGNRAELLTKLTEAGIGVGIHYPVPLHLSPALSHLGYKKGDFPASETYCDRILSIPIFPGMTQEQVAAVSAVVNDHCAHQ